MVKVCWQRKCRKNVAGVQPHKLTNGIGRHVDGRVHARLRPDGEVCAAGVREGQRWAEGGLKGGAVVVRGYVGIQGR